MCFTMAFTVCLLWLISLTGLLEQTNGSLLPVRQSSPEKTVELAVFIDQYLYHYWFSTLKRSSSSSSQPFLSSSSSSIQRFIQSYLEVLLESLNLIYAHPSLASSSSSSRVQEEGPLIGFHLAHTEIYWRGAPHYYSSTTTKKTRNKHNNLLWDTSAPNYLETFCDFANKENWSGSRWDHALLLTGVDLKFPNGENYAVAGISWDNSMCNQTYSCSVVEGKTFRSVMTATHELAHSLGVEHDGKKYNYKCPPSGYIMSYAGGDVGKIAWSPCSKHNLKAFLTTAPNVLSNQVACLNNRPEFGSRTRSEISGASQFQKIGRGARDSLMGHGQDSRRDRNAKNLDNISSLPPGKRFSLTEQCRLGGGGQWKPSGRRAHIRKLCSMLYCNNTATNELVPFHPALEGTLCARNKICKYGECVPISAYNNIQRESNYGAYKLRHP